MKRVLITEPLHAIFIEKMQKHGLQTVQLPSHSERQDVLRALSNVHGIALRSRFRIDREMIDAAPELQVIGRRFWFGIDRFELCQPKGNSLP